VKDSHSKCRRIL